ncbi:MAG: DNA-binding protein YbiB [Betaproteobacteria bacterium]|nr:DNA-binding protein YbiB [Betaproteobacteria bacterium]
MQAPRPPRLLLLAHGSRRPQWAEPFQSVLAALRTMRPDADVALCFLEAMEPSLGQALEEAARGGCEQLCLVPLFLGTGAHLERDVAQELRRVRELHPGMRVELLPAAGDSELVTQALARHALQGLDTTPAPSTPSARTQVLPWLHALSRGPRGSRDLESGQARTLMEWLLQGQLGDAQAGAALVALRMKSESAEELEGFTRAVLDAVPALPTTRAAVCLSSLNGTRRLPNQVPLLAELLRRRGVPVLVLGAQQPDGRAHTLPLWSALGLPVADGREQAAQALEHGDAVYLDLEQLSPELRRVLRWREELGVRNSAHAVAKLLAPLRGPSLLLASYTHADYAPRMTHVLGALRQPALISRGCEGEVPAHPERPSQWLRVDAQGCVHSEADEAPPGDEAVALRARAAAQSPADTLAWTRDVLEGREPPPQALQAQLQRIETLFAQLGHAGSPGEVASA